MSCRDIRGLLQDYATRELSPEDRCRADEHMLICEECRHELALVSAIVSNLETQAVQMPSPDFAARLLANLPRQQTMLSPWWALLLVPILGTAAYLFRAPLVAEALRLFRSLRIDGFESLQLPGLSLAQLGLTALVPVGLGLLVLAAGVYWGWKYYSEGW